MAMGLEIKQRSDLIDYTIKSNFDKLRYGKIYIMTDADTDGNHIKGLIINLFHELFPSLLKVKGFLGSPLTPIKSAKMLGKKDIDFYTESEYKKWIVDTPNNNSYMEH